MLGPDGTVRIDKAMLIDSGLDSSLSRMESGRISPSGLFVLCIDCVPLYQYGIDGAE